MLFKNIVSLTLPAVLIAGLAIATAANPWPVDQYLYRQYGTSANGMNARVFKPLNFDANSPEKHPVVIFFHGDGQIENNFTFGNPNVGNSLQMSDHGQFVFVTTASQTVFPCFFVLAQRQGPNRPDSLDDGAMAIISGIEAEFSGPGGVSKIDRDRLHLTGLSGGGGASVIIAGQRPGVFASGVFVCPPIPPSPWWVPGNMAGLNTWFFHAIGDGTVTWRCSRNMVNELRQLGNRPIFTRYGNPDLATSNEGSHAIWQQSYATPYLISWMAAQRRGIPSSVDPATVDFVLPGSNLQYTSPTVPVNFSGTTGMVAAASPALNGVWFSRGDFVDIHRPLADSTSNYHPAKGTVANWNFSNGESVNQWNTNPMKFYVVATGTSWDAGLGGCTYYSDTILVTKPTSGATDTTVPTISFVSPTTGTSYSTDAASVTVMGTAADNAGVAHIGWTNSRGGSGFAEGTTSWSAVVPLQTGTTNVLALKAYDTAGNTATKTLTVTQTTGTTTPTPTPAPTPVSPLSGPGLKAVYYDNMDFTGSSVTRVDPGVNFNWGTGSPEPAIQTDTFSARWEGFVQAGVSGTYTFTVGSDDGSRLWVGDTLIADNWGNHGHVQRSGNIVLAAGQKYPIKMEYYENTSGASAELRWTPPGGSSVVIPASALSLPVTNGLIGTYYDDLDFTNEKLSRVDPVVSFSWGPGSPDAGIAADTFSVRWKGLLVAPATGVYTFEIGSDDGSRLSIGGTQVVSHWGDHGHTVRTGTAALTAGQQYSITMEYYENTYGASAELKWTPPGGSKAVVPASALIAESGEAAAPPAPVALRFDFGSNADPTTAAGWNNVGNVSVGSGVADSVDTAGNPTGIGLSIVAAFNGVNTEGSTSSSGAYPVSAIKDTCFTNAGMRGKIRLTGLVPSSPYKLTFFASRVVAASDRVTKYTAGSSSVTLDAALGGGNTNTTASLTGILSDTAGNLEIEVTNNPGSAFGYLGVLEVVRELSAPQATMVGGSSASPVGEAAVLVSALSRQNHGSSGAFDIPLPLSGAPGVECRQTASGALVLELTFDKPVVSAVASLTGVGSIQGSPAISGSRILINLVGVTDGQTLSLSLANVLAQDGSAAGSAVLNFRVLAADADGNGIVNDADAALVKAKLASTVNAGNARFDINRSGTLNTTDVVLTNSRRGGSAL